MFRVWFRLLWLLLWWLPGMFRMLQRLYGGVFKFVLLNVFHHLLFELYCNLFRYINKIIKGEMIMREIEIMDKSIVDCMEAYDYEVNARLQVIGFMISSGYDVKNESFKEYHKEYTESFVRYKLAQQEFFKTIVKPQVTDLDEYKWELDFHEGVVRVTEVK